MARSDFRFMFPFRVRYSEIDGQKVVFNAHYLTYFDTAISEYFRDIGHDQVSATELTGADLHVVRTVVDYRRPIRFDAEIEVHVRVDRIGRSSLTFALEILPRDGEDAYAMGEVVWVNTDQSSHTALPVPTELVALLEEREDRTLRR